jgi:broad specificity phosphatase PhoE
MLVYFIRHGLTPDNIALRYQTALTPLAPEGEVQAGKVADRLKDIDINEIWSSPMRRAKHTAEIINQYHQVPLIEQDELREIQRPKIMEGKLNSDPTIQAIRQEIRFHWGDPHYKYGDGESFADACLRGQQLLEKISQRAGKVPDDFTLVVTTHGIILRIILLHLLLGKAAEPKFLLDLQDTFELENTGISVARHSQHHWKVVTINDFAHL